MSAKTCSDAGPSGGPDLGGLFRPSSVAVIGASQDPSSMGGRALRALQSHGYSGAIYPVNPKRESIGGLPCYPTLTDIPHPVDTMLVLVGPAKTPDLMCEGAEKGVRWAVLLNAGFSEVGAEGSALQDQVSKIADAAGIRIVGPNCGGIINVLDGVPLGFLPAFALDRFEPGPLGLVAQSGGVLTNALNKVYDRKIGLTFGVSTGNEADISVLDFVEFMLDDPATKAISLYTESLRDAPRFIAACRKAVQVGKPIVMLKGGSSEAGKETAASHTGAIATSQRVLESIARRYGVCLVDDMDDLLEVGWYLAKEDLTRNPPRRVAAVATSGGTAVLTADALDKAGIVLPQPDPGTLSRIRESLPAFGISRNPIDITAQYFNEPELFRNMLRTLENASEFDAIVVSLAMITTGYAERFAADIDDFRRSSSVPIVVTWTGGSMTEEGVAVLRERGIPVFRRLGTCAQGMKAWADFSDARERHAAADVLTAGSTAALELPAAGPLTEFEAMQALGKAGLPFARAQVVRSRDEAVKVAGEFGLPVVMKLSSRHVTHKSDAGGVKVGLRTEESVVAAYDALCAIPRSAEDQDLAGEVLVEELLTDAVEFIVGVERDPQFGWVLLIGSGGTLAELLGDTAVAPLPVDRVEAHQLLKSLKTHALLTGFRGTEPLDVEGLVDFIVIMSDVASQLPADVSSVEVNPVMVHPSGVAGVDALVVRGSREEKA